MYASDSGVPAPCFGRAVQRRLLKWTERLLACLMQPRGILIVVTRPQLGA